MFIVHVTSTARRPGPLSVTKLCQCEGAVVSLSGAEGTCTMLAQLVKRANEGLHFVHCSDTNAAPWFVLDVE